MIYFYINIEKKLLYIKDEVNNHWAGFIMEYLSRDYIPLSLLSEKIYIRAIFLRYEEFREAKIIVQMVDTACFEKYNVF